MIERRAFLVALIVTCGCGPNEAPKKAADAKQVMPAIAESPDGKQQAASAVSQTKIPRVAILVFGTKNSVSATALAPPLIRGRLTELPARLQVPVEEGDDPVDRTLLDLIGAGGPIGRQRGDVAVQRVIPGHPLGVLAAFFE